MIIINSCPSLGRRNVVSDDKKSTLVLVGRVLFLCSNALELFLVVTLIVSRDTFKVKKRPFQVNSIISGSLQPKAEGSPAPDIIAYALIGLCFHLP